MLDLCKLKPLHVSMIALLECLNVILESIDLISSRQGIFSPLSKPHYNSNSCSVVFPCNDFCSNTYASICLANQVSDINSVSKNLRGFLKPLETPLPTPLNLVSTTSTQSEV